MGKWLGKLAGILSTEVVALSILGAVLTVGATIWAAIRDWGPAIILVFMGGAALTFFAINQYRLWRGKRPLDFESLVREWLYEARFTIRNDPQPNATFQFVATDAENRPVVIGRLISEPFLTIAARIAADPKDQPKLGAITAAPTSTLIEDMRIEMGHLGIGFRGLKHPVDAIEIEIKVACDDSLTKLVFMQRVQTMRQGLVTLQALISKAFKQSGKIPTAEIKE